MSLIAIGGTAIAGSTITAGTITAGAALLGAGASIYGISQQGKAQQGMGGMGAQLDPRVMQDILSGLKEYQPVDVQAVASETAINNAGQGVKLATKSAKKLNAAATDDVIAAMNKLYGSPEAYSSLKEKALADISSHLDGQVSASSRALVGRGLLASGVSELGDGATADAMTGYLGLTSENLATQGGEEFKSLYSTWRQAVPLINGAQILDKFTINPGDAVQSEIANAQNAYQSSIGIAGVKMQAATMGYQSSYNNMLMQQDAAASRANNNAAMAGAIAQGVGAVAGAYAGSRTPGMDGYGANNYGGNGTTTKYGGFGGSNVNGSQVYRPQVI